MPAAAVIPAPIAYTKIVAVKKLVVGSAVSDDGPPTGGHRRFPDLVVFTNDVCSASARGALHRVSRSKGPGPRKGSRASRVETFTLKKLECSKQATLRLNTLAWNNGIGPRFLFCWLSELEVMIKRSGRGHSYFGVRGEILGSPKDGQLRKHLPRTLSLIKNDS